MLNQLASAAIPTTVPEPTAPTAPAAPSNPTAPADPTNPRAPVATTPMAPGRPDDDSAEVRSFPDIAGQCGLATRRQLQEHGWSSSAIRHRLGDRWHLVYPRVVAPHTRRVLGRDRLVAAQLWAGPDAVLTGLAGLAAQGLRHGHEVLRCHFLVAADHVARRHEDVDVLRTDRPLQAYLTVGALQVMHPARCLVDAARWDVRTREGRLSLTIAALQQGLVRPQRLHHELRHTRRNDTVDVRDGLRAFERGAWSLPELRMAEIFDSSLILPTVLLNPTLRTPSGQRLPTPDGYIEQVGLAIQVHSRTFHAREADWQGTVEADGLLIRHGIVVEPFTPKTIDTDPKGVLEAVEQTYLRLLDRPLPEIHVIPRSC